MRGAGPRRKIDIWECSVDTVEGSWKPSTMGCHHFTVAYVQRQMDHILCDFRAWCRLYVDDIVIASQNFPEHCKHLHMLFRRLMDYNIHLQPKKAFIGFPSITLLGQHIDSLGMTGGFRQYIAKYAWKAEPLQARKTLLLKEAPRKDAPRKNLSHRRVIHEPSRTELNAFRELQQEFPNAPWLVHFDRTRQP